MSIRDIALMGNPALARPADPVADPASPEIAALVADMKDTMARAGGIGIAAPQIGVTRRVVIFYVPPDEAERPRSLEGLPLRILINPVITPLDPDEPLVEDWEGCLSVPGLKGLVPRHRRVRYQGLGLDGEPIDVVAEDFHARVVQHECDHLEGILYPKHLSSLSNLSYLQDWNPLSHIAETEEMTA
jgi:peptide deformylase